MIAGFSVLITCTERVQNCIYETFARLAFKLSPGAEAARIGLVSVKALKRLQLLADAAVLVPVAPEHVGQVIDLTTGAAMNLNLRTGCRNLVFCDLQKTLTAGTRATKDTPGLCRVH